MKKIEIDEMLGLKRIEIDPCPNCHDKRYSYYDENDNFVFNTVCDCKVNKMNEERSSRLTDSIYGRSRIERNKSLCGLKKHDIEEINTVKYITNSYNIDAYNELIKYGDVFSDKTSRGYYICGTTGTGKTLLVKKLAAMLLNKSYSVLFITTVDLLTNIRKRISQPDSRNLAKYAIDVDLLILDDFGVERGNDWETEELLKIFECRWGMSKPIIFTSNLSLDQVKKKYDKHGRIYSRILGGSEKVFTINGIDKRAEQFNKRNNQKSAEMSV